MTNPRTPLAAASTAAALPDFECLFKSATGNAVARPNAAPISRAEFLSRTDSVANGLRAGPPARLLACTDALNFALGFCALLRAGKDIVLPPNLQTGSVNHADCEVLDDRLIHSLDKMNVSSNDNADLPADSRVILFTSGSTGEPKRIEKRLRQLSGEAAVLEARFGSLIKDATITATVPHLHIYGLLFRIIWPLAAGRAFMAEPVLGANLHRARDNVLVSSPAFLRRIEPGDLAHAAPRLIFSSGGKLPENVARTLAVAANCPLIEVYGSTETGGIAWREWSPDCDGKWTAFDGVDLHVDKVGRLQVRSTATNAIWIDAGDVVSLEDATRFLLHGRDDGVLKIEDKRVSPAALVARLDMHEWIAEARVIALSGSRSQLGAVARLSDQGQCAFDSAGRNAFINELMQYLQRHFDAVVVPRKWRFVDELPVNASGKTTHASLVALFDHDGGRS